jgi:hypothetical protein
MCSRKDRPLSSFNHFATTQAHFSLTPVPVLQYTQPTPLGGNFERLSQSQVSIRVQLREIYSKPANKIGMTQRIAAYGRPYEEDSR